MEMCVSPSDPDRNLESEPGNVDDSSGNEFHFGDLIVESSVDMRPTRTSLATPEDPTVLHNDFDGGDIPIFYETIPSLQEMSSLVVAISLWRRALSLQHNSVFNLFTKIDQQGVEKLLLELPVPRLIREIVTIYLTRVAREMEDWLRYYQLNLFTAKRGSGEVTINTGDLLFCCWLPEGKIDHRESALNMLSNPRLTQVDKFKIMCRYCLADEVKKCSAESLPSAFTTRIDSTSDENALMYYWLCYMKGDLDKVPKRNGESAESYLITAFNVNTWSAIEYFWHRLNVNEQTSKIELLLNRRPEFQKKLFSKMNELQKFHIFSKMPLKIMQNFWMQPGQARFTFTAWVYIRNFVDYQQFYDIIKTLRWQYSTHTEEKIKCLVDIWNICPDHLKKLAFEPAFMILIISFHDCEFNYWSCDNIELLLAYLSDASAKQRKKILFEGANKLVLKIDESAMDELIKLCLPDANDVVKFRNYVLKSTVIRSRLCDELHDNDFESLYRFLNYFCPDLKTRSEYCCKILESFAVRGIPFYRIDPWIKVINFIDENILLHFPDQALEFKKELASSFAYFCCELWNDDDLAKMMEIVNQVLDVEELSVFKLDALETVQTRYRWNKFDENIIGGFLSWCCDNDCQKVRQFVKTLSIDDIFDYGWHSLNLHCVSSGDVDEEPLRKFFARLDKCLLWYFENIEDVNRFKLEKVFAYRDIGPWRLMLFERCNNVCMKKTLPWFFQDDRDAIELFKEMYKDENIAQLI